MKAISLPGVASDRSAVLDRARPEHPQVARLADWGGLALLAIFAWQVFFVADASLHWLAIGVAVTGIGAALAAHKSLRTSVDVPLALYTVLVVLSAIVHSRQFSPIILTGDPVAPWQPAAHALAILLFFYGASALLAEPSRVRSLMVGIVAGVSVLGVVASYNHLTSGFDSRLINYTLIPQWSGYPELGLLFAIAFPMALALAVVHRSRAVVIASSLVALTFVGYAAAVYSRGANVSISVAYAVMGILELRVLKGRRLLWAACLAMLVLVVALAIGLVPGRSLIAFGTGRLYTTNTVGAYVSRFAMWGRATAMARDHVLLGVGPGNYSDAMRKVYVTAADPYLFQFHAHNTILQVAAESGVPALIAFLLIWWRVLAGLARLCGRTRVGVVALGLFGALVTVVVRSLGDHFLSGLPTADRTSFLVWTLLAASAATIRYGRSPVNAGGEVPAR
jgi:O-antigen ligase